MNTVKRIICFLAGHQPDVDPAVYAPAPGCFRVFSGLLCVRCGTRVWLCRACRNLMWPALNMSGCGQNVTA